MAEPVLLEGADISIPAYDREIPGYEAVPTGVGPFPIVLVAPEIFGVNENIRAICRLFAQHGYYAVAPDLFIRQGDVSNITDHDELRKIVSRVPDGQAIGDLDAAARYAGSRQGESHRLFMTGFCWGGRLAWLYAAWNPNLRAAVAWYGRLIGDVDDLHEQHPLGIVEGLKCPVLGLYGGRDQSIPLDTVEAMRHEIHKHQRNSDLHVYPDAGHGFFADFRPSYNEGAAKDGWNRMLAWFEQSAR